MWSKISFLSEKEICYTSHNFMKYTNKAAIHVRRNNEIEFNNKGLGSFIGKFHQALK